MGDHKRKISVNPPLTRARRNAGQGPAHPRGFERLKVEDCRPAGPLAAPAESDARVRRRLTDPAPALGAHAPCLSFAAVPVGHQAPFNRVDILYFR